MPRMLDQSAAGPKVPPAPDRCGGTTPAAVLVARGPVDGCHGPPYGRRNGQLLRWGPQVYGGPGRNLPVDGDGPGTGWRLSGTCCAGATCSECGGRRHVPAEPVRASRVGHEAI